MKHQDKKIKKYIYRILCKIVYPSHPPFLSVINPEIFTFFDLSKFDGNIFYDVMTQVPCFFDAF